MSWKLSRPVLRGRGDGDAALLPDFGGDKIKAGANRGGNQGLGRAPQTTTATKNTTTQEAILKRGLFYIELPYLGTRCYRQRVLVFHGKGKNRR